ncbi:MAG: divalent-cation tolerance protein CutA [Brachymonas sp.]|nr:divalent-cation tolerance protein CutA [Brachymonas sp.]
MPSSFSSPAAEQDPACIALVITTVDDETVAQNMARAMVEQRLAACVQIQAIESTYIWEAALQEHKEWQLSCKTTASGSAALQQALLEMHPYAVPMLYALPVAWVHRPYADWVAQRVADAQIRPDQV